LGSIAIATVAQKRSQHHSHRLIRPITFHASASTLRK
jgi:hypothetical protein